MMRILIADDHQLIREGLRAILREEADLRVIGEATNGPEALEMTALMKVDLLILDISLPGMNGLEVLKELKKRKIKTPVLFLTMHPERRYALRAFRAGAAGYLTKNDASTNLVKAIRTIGAGTRYISERVAQTLALSLEELTIDPPHLALSDREYQVFCLLVSGTRAKEIAYELAVSEATIYTYLDRIYEKMKTRSVAELTRYALEQGLIE